MDGESITLKSLQAHVIKTTITSVITACVAAVIIMVGFYYNTNGRISTNEENIRAILEVQNEQGKDINVIKEKMSADNANSINLNKRFDALEDNQKEIYKLVLQIAQSQKRNGN